MDEDIRIIEYSHSLAAEVADMWNKSASGWNGMFTNRNAEMVVREHENSHHINVFLAQKGCEIIGYCSLDRYTKDEGALYVNTLNVRPDHHGKKVGKMLVLACVRKTVEMGWPRLDLYTWPGNTKAVPLYKKCGFFWEKRDEVTHLMNFMPTVLKTEALSDFFSEADWYCDSTRLIEVKPDGRMENKFDYFEYSWERNGGKLRVEFERTGRGMRLIETDDYIISSTVENHELVFGMDYRITYDIINKSGRPLNVELHGMNDKNVTFRLDQALDVNEKAVLEGCFHVDPVTEEQKPGRTHPCVTTEIKVNGRKALFKTGIEPVYPAAMQLYVPGPECHIGLESFCVIELENKFREDAVITFTMKEQDGIRFPVPTHTVMLKAGERSTVDIPFVLERFIYYSADIAVEAMLPCGTAIPFVKRFDKAFRGRSGILWGESEEVCEIINGPFAVGLNKQENFMWIWKVLGDHLHPFWVFPKVGRPFSSELSNRKPDLVECFREEESAVMKLTYDLDEFRGIRLIVVVKLEAGGILKHHYEIENTSDAETGEEIWISDTFRSDLHRGVLPYDGQFVEIEEYIDDLVSYWNSDRLTENWFFSKGAYMTRGVAWEQDQIIKFDNWSMFFEYNLGKLAPHGRAATKPVTMAVGVFERWQDFRLFALKKSRFERPFSTGHTCLAINGGNPFVQGDFDVGARELRSIGIEPQITVDRGSGKNPDVISAEVETNAYIVGLKSVIFRKSNNVVLSGTAEEQGLKSLWADNGVIRIKASAGFANALYSMRYNGEEWLNTSFPKPYPKAWWNPWIGGISPYVKEMSPESMLEESCTIEFAALDDQTGNRWQGIKTSVEVSKHEQRRGLKLDTYFLMLPGVPVLCGTHELYQDTGRYLEWNCVGLDCYFKTAESLTDSYFGFETPDGGNGKLKAGADQHYIGINRPVHFTSSSRKEKLYVYTDFVKMSGEAGVNNSSLGAAFEFWSNVPNKAHIFTPPVFFIFTDETLKGKWLRDLDNIRFGSDGL